jgi:hypothetical protein
MLVANRNQTIIHHRMLLLLQMIIPLPSTTKDLLP